MPLSRRRFLGHAALAAGAAISPRWLSATPGSALATRTSAARTRYARVAAFINRRHPDLRAKIIVAADEAGAARRTWLTVLATWRAGEKEPEVKAVAVSVDEAEGSFICNGIEYRLGIVR